MINESRVIRDVEQDSLPFGVSSAEADLHHSSVLRSAVNAPYRSISSHDAA
jgi:hypothetical protein